MVVAAKHCGRKFSTYENEIALDLLYFFLCYRMCMKNVWKCFLFVWTLDFFYYRFTKNTSLIIQVRQSSLLALTLPKWSSECIRQTVVVFSIQRKKNYKSFCQERKWRCSRHSIIFRRFFFNELHLCEEAKFEIISDYNVNIA